MLQIDRGGKKYMKRPSIFLKQREISWSWVSVLFIDMQYSFLKIGFCEWKFIGQDVQNNFVFQETRQIACKSRLFKVLCTSPATRGSSSWLVATGVIVWWWQTEPEKEKGILRKRSLLASGSGEAGTLLSVLLHLSTHRATSSNSLC